MATTLGCLDLPSPVSPRSSEPSMTVAPTVLATFHGLPQGAPLMNHYELGERGEWHLVDAPGLCARIGCTYEDLGGVHRFDRGDRSIMWADGTNHTFDPRNAKPATLFLPAAPRIQDGVLHVPARFIAEALGLNTHHDASTGTITVFDLPPAAKQVPLRLVNRAGGSEVSLSYVVMAHVRADEVCITYELAPHLACFEEGVGPTRVVPVPPGLGTVGEFVVTPDDRTFIATSSGTIVEATTEGARVVTGAGKRFPKEIGDAVPLEELGLFGIGYLTASTDGNTLYALDGVRGVIFAADLLNRTATRISDPLSPLDFTPHGNDLLLLRKAGKLELTLIDGRTASHRTSPCFMELFPGAAIRGVTHVAAADTWIVLDAGNRSIIEAQLTFEGGPCAILRTTIVPNEIAYLNGFGSIDPTVMSPDEVLILDSDGFNLIRYRVGGEMSIIHKHDLDTRPKAPWILPTTVAERDGCMYVVGNLAHRVFQYCPLLGNQDSWVGKGVPVRENMWLTTRDRASFGFSVHVENVDGEIWIGDHFSRRIIVVNEVFSRQLFAPVDTAVMGGLVGFTVVEDAVYMTDNTRGTVLAWRPGDTRPHIIAGKDYEEPGHDPERVRRIVANRPVPERAPFSEVEFGLPLGIEAASNGDLFVSDLYRHGVWRLDLHERTAESAIGFRSVSDYHTGGFNGNVGLSAHELRLSSPYTIENDLSRGVLLVPTGHAGEILFVREDMTKTCVGVPDTRVAVPTHARFLEDGSLVVVDSYAAALLVFSPPDLSCLTTDVAALPPR